MSAVPCPGSYRNFPWTIAIRVKSIEIMSDEAGKPGVRDLGGRNIHIQIHILW